MSPVGTLDSVERMAQGIYLLRGISPQTPLYCTCASLAESRSGLELKQEKGKTGRLCILRHLTKGLLFDLTQSEGHTDRSGACSLLSRTNAETQPPVPHTDSHSPGACFHTSRIDIPGRPSFCPCVRSMWRRS